MTQDREGEDVPVLYAKPVLLRMVREDDPTAACPLDQIDDVETSSLSLPPGWVLRYACQHHPPNV